MIIYAKGMEAKISQGTGTKPGKLIKTKLGDLMLR
jgi:hypothetical protein